MTTASVRPPAAEVLVPERASDPDRWLSAAAWTLIVFSCAQVLLFSFGRDQGIYAVVADGILHGKMPYRDVWDFKPPGIFLVYALGQALFGKSMVAPRVLEVAGMLGMVFGMQRIGALAFGGARVGLVGGALACWIHAQLEFWHTGQPESFGGFVTVIAIWLALMEPPRRRRWLLLLGQGALWGVAFIMKPPLAGGAIVIAAYLLRRDRDRGMSSRRALVAPLLVAAGSLIPIVLVAVWFVARGAWPALSWTMFTFTPGYTALGTEGHRAARGFYWAFQESFFKFSAIAPAGVLAALLLPSRHEREREGTLVVLGVIAMQLVGVTMQGKYFQYHYSASLQLIALVGGLGLYKLWRRFLEGGLAGAAVFATAIAVLGSMREAANDLPDGFLDRCAIRMRWLMGRSEVPSREAADERLAVVADYNLAADRRVASLVAQRVSAGVPVYVWGFEPVIYWLSERASPTRFIYDVPQRATWEREPSRRELLEALAARPPGVIVVQHNDIFPAVTGDALDSARAVATFPELERLLRTDFTLLETIEDFDVYERRAR